MPPEYSTRTTWSPTGSAERPITTWSVERTGTGAPNGVPSTRAWKVPSTGPRSTSRNRVAPTRAVPEPKVARAGATAAVPVGWRAGSTVIVPTRPVKDWWYGVSVAWKCTW